MLIQFRGRARGVSRHLPLVQRRSHAADAMASPLPNLLTWRLHLPAAEYQVYYASPEAFRSILRSAVPGGEHRHAVRLHNHFVPRRAAGPFLRRLNTASSALVQVTLGL